MAPVDDQRLVEQFPAEGADPPLRDRVRPRSPHRDADDTDRFGGEDRVKRGGELGVPVADQIAEPGDTVAEVHHQVPGALGHPGAVRAGGYPEQPDPPAGKLDDEQEVQLVQQHRFDVGEVAGQDALCLGRQELPPVLPSSPRSRVDAGAAQDQPDRRRSDPMAEPDQLAMDPPVTPAGILGGHPQHQLLEARTGWWPAAATRNAPAAADQVAMPAQHGLRRHEQPGPATAGYQPAQRRLQRWVGPARPGSGDLPPKHRQLMAQQEDLSLLGRLAASEQAQPAHHRPDDQVQQS